MRLFMGRVCGTGYVCDRARVRVYLYLLSAPVCGCECGMNNFASTNLFLQMGPHARVVQL